MRSRLNKNAINILENLIISLEDNNNGSEKEIKSLRNIHGYIIYGINRNDEDIDWVIQGLRSELDSISELFFEQDLCIVKRAFDEVESNILMQSRKSGCLGLAAAVTLGVGALYLFGGNSSSNERGAEQTKPIPAAAQR